MNFSVRLERITFPLQLARNQTPLCVLCFDYIKCTACEREKRYDLTQLNIIAGHRLLIFMLSRSKLQAAKKSWQKIHLSICLSIYTQQWVGIDFHFVATMFVTQERRTHKNLYEHIYINTLTLIRPEMNLSAGELNGKLFQDILALCNSWQRESTSMIIFLNFETVFVLSIFVIFFLAAAFPLVLLLLWLLYLFTLFVCSRKTFWPLVHAA